MANNTNVNQHNLRSLLEKEKLNGTNFLDWHRNLRIVLKFEGKLRAIEEPLPDSPAENATVAQQNAYRKLFDEQEKITLIMLASMTPDLQKEMEDRTKYEMTAELKICLRNRLIKSCTKLRSSFTPAKWRRVNL